jgi:hypothetical protein
LAGHNNNSNGGGDGTLSVKRRKTIFNEVLFPSNKECIGSDAALQTHDDFDA